MITLTWIRTAEILRMTYGGAREPKFVISNVDGFLCAALWRGVEGVKG